MLGLSVISGRVVDDRGTPVRDALVGARAERDQSVVRTNGQGRFSLGIDSATPVRLLARKSGYVYSVRAGVDPWAENVELELCRAGDVSGRIVAPVLPRRWRIVLRRWDEDCVRPGRYGSVLRRPGGIFSISRLPCGVYEVTAEAPGGPSSAPGVVVDLSPGEEVGGLEIPL